MPKTSKSKTKKPKRASKAKPNKAKRSASKHTAPKRIKAKAKPKASKRSKSKSSKSKASKASKRSKSSKLSEKELIVRPISSRLSDPRLPPMGSFISREYKGVTIGVKQTETGFEIVEPKGKVDGVTYRGLSGVTKAFTGCETNGFAFWGLNAKPEATHAAAE